VTTASGWRVKPASSVRVDLVIPVLNEAHVLEPNVRKVHRFFTDRIGYTWRIVIAENGSTDGTEAVARRLCESLPGVELLTLARAGRGGALRAAWSRSDADVVSYTDVDLSTALDELPRLYAALVSDGFDVAVGSRLAPGARTTRSVRRQILSRGYNILLKLVLGVGFSDAQTGFKALTREVVEKVLPLVKDDHWFLDTELLVLAERLGYRIADLPVTWVEDDDSRVRIVSTVWQDLKGVYRLKRSLGAGREPAAAGRADHHEGAVR
jgi:glycosyltransferase involved in cell wall biosynthesis